MVAHEEGIVRCKRLLKNVYGCFVIGWPEGAFNQGPLARQGMQDSRFDRPFWESFSARSYRLGLSPRYGSTATAAHRKRCCNTSYELPPSEHRCPPPPGILPQDQGEG